MSRLSTHNGQILTAAKSNHNETSVANYMNTDFITVSGNMVVGDACNYLLAQLKSNEIPSQLFIVVNDNELQGMLSVKKLLQCQEKQLPLFSLMAPVVHTVLPNSDRKDVVTILAKEEQDMLPVVENKQLVGILGEREIAKLLKDEDTEDAQRQGANLPLEQPYLQTSPWALWRKRTPWLLMLFVAEAYTGTVIQTFEEQLEAVIALAFFIPLLIGNGGNSGIQITSTLVRAMALGEVSLRNLGTVLRKEMTASLLIAFTIAIIAWGRAWIMGVGMDITLVVSLSVVAIIIWSAMVSSIIPLVLKRLSIDPAVVSAPFITTFVDGTGLIIYFEIAKHILNI